MKKILYVHHGSADGGAPRSLSFLIDKIPNDKYSADFLCMSDREGNSELFQNKVDHFYFEHYMTSFNGSTVCDIRGFDEIVQLIKTPITIFNTKRYLKESKPDIVHINSTCLWPVAKAVKKFDSNIKVICHIREPLVNSYSGKKIRKQCERYVDGFVAIDRFDAESMNIDFGRIEIIYNFVNFDTYNTKNKSKVLYDELGIHEDNVILLYLARLGSFNGAFEMVNASVEYLKSNKRVHLCVVGVEDISDDYTKKVIDAAQNLQNIHFMPFRKDVPDVIASSDIMIVPFVEPHFARSIIEAAAMGVPSLASNIGGLQELVVDGETGMLFDYRTFDDF